MGISVILVTYCSTLCDALLSQASFVGLSPGLMFMLRTIGQNSRHDVYKEAVLQTLAAIRGERKATKKE